MLSHAGIRSAQVVTNLNSNSNFSKHTTLIQTFTIKSCLTKSMLRVSHDRQLSLCHT